MMSYILVDAANMFFRARHVVRGDMNTKIGMSYHIMFNSINKVFREQKGTHVVLCLEGRSWRKDAYEPYKNNCLLYTSPSPRDKRQSRMPSSA